MEFDLLAMTNEFGMMPIDIVRMIRNQMLTDSDWTQLPDCPLSDAKRQEWAEYRVYLRDFPSQFEGFRYFPDVLEFAPPPL